MNRHLSSAALTLALCLSANAWSQWSVDPQKNTPLANVAGAAQVQPQIAAREDGHWWISWLALHPQGTPPQGYDVYLQRLGPDGREQFAHQGVQVAKLGVGWTEDYGLAADVPGNAVLTFQDDRPNPPQRAISASKIDSAGKLLWNAQTAHSGHAPHVSILPDGQSFIGWSADTENSVRLRKLDAQGRPVWHDDSGAPLDFLLAEPNFTYALADLQATADGSVIVSFVRSRGFSGAKHLYANKISPSGQLLWGSNHVKVFEGGSLQQGNFPRFVADGKGGAVFAWYSIDPKLQVFAQHVLANGQLAFAANGVPVSTDVQQARVSPAVSYQPATGEITVLWTELDNAMAQHRRGLYAQRISASGARQWGETGRPLRPLALHDIGDLQSIAADDGTLAFWIETNPGQPNSIQGIKLDAAGAPLCPQFVVSTRATNKSRLASASAPSGQVLLVWEEQGQTQGSDIYLQGVRRDCKLGGQ